MDPVKTLEGQTVQTIAEAYFLSLNDHNKKLHIVESKQAGAEEIQTDIRLWYAGFTACARLLGTNINQLPVLESVMTQITKQFPDKARLVA